MFPARLSARVQSPSERPPPPHGPPERWPDRKGLAQRLKWEYFPPVRVQATPPQNRSKVVSPKATENAGIGPSPWVRSGVMIADLAPHPRGPGRRCFLVRRESRQPGVPAAAAGSWCSGRFPEPWGFRAAAAGSWCSGSAAAAGSWCSGRFPEPWGFRAAAAGSWCSGRFPEPRARGTVGFPSRSGRCSGRFPEPWGFRAAAAGFRCVGLVRLRQRKVPGCRTAWS